MDQLVCTRARVFAGTRLSTYSGYTYRIRGYMNDIKDKSTFFTTSPYPQAYQHPVPTPPWSTLWASAIWGREFPAAWMDWEQSTDEKWLED